MIQKIRNLNLRNIRDSDPLADLRRPRYFALLFIGIITTIYHLWFAYSYGILLDKHLVLHMWSMMCMGTIYVFDPEIDTGDSISEVVDNYLILPLELILASATSIYVITNYERLYIDSPGIYNSVDVIVGFILIVLVIDLCRRTFGWVIASVGILGLGYASTANFWPGIFRTSPIPPDILITTLTVQFIGLYDLLVRVAATYVIVFLILAGFLESYGAMEYFMKVGASLGRKIRSGITQTAVLASVGMGSINGSAAANAATTGMMTIPLMKTQGVDEDTAGAIEAVASSGGQIMPPVMGAAAFIMAEIIGTSYLRIITIGLLPALLFYFTIVIAVYTITIKEGAIRGDTMSSGEAELVDVDEYIEDQTKGRKEKIEDVSIGSHSIPDLSGELFNPNKSVPVIILEGFYLWAPISVLVYTLVILGYGAVLAGFWSTITAVVAAFIQYLVLEDGWIDPLKLFIADTLDGMRLGSQNAAAISIAVGVMGLFVGVLGLTGFSIKLTQQLIPLAGGSLAVLLFIVMLASILFGLGMPTVAAYIVAVLLVAPALVEFGVRVEVAHFFVFYFAILSAITPPVAIACIITSSISGGSFYNTCYKALIIGLPLFILPYVFVANPALLFWEFPYSLYLFFVCFISLIALSFGVINYIRGQLTIVSRILFLILPPFGLFATTLPIATNYISIIRISSITIIAIFMAYELIGASPSPEITA